MESFYFHSHFWMLFCGNVLQRLYYSIFLRRRRYYDNPFAIFVCYMHWNQLEHFEFIISSSLPWNSRSIALYITFFKALSLSLINTCSIIFYGAWVRKSHATNTHHPFTSVVSFIKKQNFNKNGYNLAKGLTSELVSSLKNQRPCRLFYSCLFLVSQAWLFNNRKRNPCQVI